MKSITYSILLMLLMLGLSIEGFAQIKHFDLYVQQPSIEQCGLSSNANIVENQLNIYPNPSHGEITISLAGPICGSKVFIQVLSLDSKILLYNEEYPGKSAFQKRIDLNSLSRGIYVLKVSGETFVTNKRVVLF
jgi:hypothetical protein